MNNIKVFLVGLLGFFAISCSTPKNISYFQDIKSDTTYQIANDLDIKFRIGDKLRVLVHSRDPLLNPMFNLYSQTTGSTSQDQQKLYAYTVDNDSCIDFPSLGRIKVANKNRQQVADDIKKELIEKDLLKDPVVNVTFENMYIAVLGEVVKPGRYAIDKERITILDALAMAGDLTIQAQRKIRVMRRLESKEQSYELDLTNIKELIESPAYFLQQDDVVYVDCNKYRKRQTTVNGNNMRSSGFFMSIASVLLSAIAILF